MILPRTNDWVLPTDHIPVEIQTLSDDAADMNFARPDLSQTELTKTQTIRQHRGVKRSISKFAPIFSLPDEILSEIFLLTCAYDSETLEECEISSGNRLHRPTHTRHEPLAIGKICSHWRNIAWSNSQLWSSISITISRFKRQQELVNQWLYRSKACLLDIHLTVKDISNFGWSDSVAYCVIMDLLISRVKRWRSVDIMIPEQHFDILKDVCGPLPFLNKLCIRNPANFTVQRPRIKFNAGLEQLEELKLDACDLNANFQWDSLTSFSGAYLSVDQCMNVLRSASKLSYCHFGCIYGHTKQYSSISVPNITSFSVNARTEDEMTSLLTNIVLPRLKELKLFVTSSNTCLTHETYSMISRSASTLEKLVIVNDSTLEQGYIKPFIKCLETLGALRELHVVKRLKFYGYELINRRAKNRPSELAQVKQVLLPKLEILNLQGIETGPRLDLCRMLESGWNVKGKPGYDENAAQLAKHS
ncbi:hypothetical protein BDQ12DRAFT_723350 [Crucibulum laeve]|uniref:Uncharacterized protein n=1 Tax=Crucibulum laeve TaxID=68775 RepID=A0A5C3LZX2_9AGAR|nr:hypothetical protein BDQ12DRAFT_723350 [Crucibulum laeve]